MDFRTTSGYSYSTSPGVLNFMLQNDGSLVWTTFHTLENTPQQFDNISKNSFQSLIEEKDSVAFANIQPFTVGEYTQVYSLIGKFSKSNGNIGNTKLIKINSSNATVPTGFVSSGNGYILSLQYDNIFEPIPDAGPSRFTGTNGALLQVDSQLNILASRGIGLLYSDDTYLLLTSQRISRHSSGGVLLSYVDDNKYPYLFQLDSIGSNASITGKKINAQIGAPAGIAEDRYGRIGLISSELPPFTQVTPSIITPSGN